MIEQRITIIGLGGIGSWTANVVARIGCKFLMLCDYDRVEEHNLGNQAYFSWDVGIFKTYALKSRFEKFPPHQLLNVSSENRRMGGDFMDYSGIVIAAVDSMESRLEIFKGIKFNSNVPLFVEAGTAEHSGSAYVLNPRDYDQVKGYEADLTKRSKENLVAQCVSPYMGMVFAGVIGRWLIKFSCGWRPLFVKRTEIMFGNEPQIENFTLPVWWK